jgi:hypothetical protein
MISQEREIDKQNCRIFYTVKNYHFLRILFVWQSNWLFAFIIDTKVLQAKPLIRKYRKYLSDPTL